MGGRGARFRILGAKGAKPFTCCKQIGAPAPNQCQIITFLTWKTDNIAKLRIVLKRMLLETLSNKRYMTCIKLVYL